MLSPSAGASTARRSVSAHVLRRCAKAPAHAHTQLARRVTARAGLGEDLTTLVPYFNVHEGKMDEFRACVEELAKLAANEDKVVFYQFSFCGQRAMCREGYNGAEGVLEHIDNVGAVLQRALTVADLERLEVHGPPAEVAALKPALADFDVAYFTLEGPSVLRP